MRYRFLLAASVYVFFKYPCNQKEQSLINCEGTYTTISGSLILPQVRQAMVEASKQYVQLRAVQEPSIPCS